MFSLTQGARALRTPVVRLARPPATSVRTHVLARASVTSAARAAPVARAVPLVARAAGRRGCSSSAAADTSSALTAKYPGAMRAMHWIVGGGMVGTVGAVLAAQQCEKGDPNIGKFMHLHKSLALATSGAVVVRIAVALVSKRPPPVPGHMLEQLGAKLGHLSLYGFMIFMPVSGITMGYFGGKGLPFFKWSVPGKQNGTPEDGALAKQAYQLHKLVGYWGKFLIPMHVGAVGFHFAKGQNILRRML